MALQSEIVTTLPRALPGCHRGGTAPLSYLRYARTLQKHSSLEQRQLRPVL
jgi:hypothetical protein